MDFDEEFDEELDEELDEDLDEELDWQVLDDEECFNSFECKSNLCVINKCISEKIFNKFLESLE